jgi:hypothetical protein
MIRLARHFISLRDYLFWKSTFQNERVRLLGAIDDVLLGLTSVGPFESCLRGDINAVRRQVQKLRRNAIDVRPSRLPVRLREAEVQLRSASTRAGRILTTSRRLDKLHHRISCHRNDLMQRSVIPGPKFQGECDGHATEIDGYLLSARSASIVGLALKALGRAKNEVRRLCELIQRGERLREGVPRLRAAAKDIDKTLVSVSPAFSSDYEASLASIERLEREVLDCRYTRYNERALAEANRRLDSLVRDIDFRKKRARAEIELWMENPEILDKFDLDRFPKNLTSGDVCRWLNISPELEKFVNDRAAGSRQVNAAVLAQRDPRLGLSWSEIGGATNESKVESYVQAAAAFRA